VRCRHTSTRRGVTDMGAITRFEKAPVLPHVRLRVRLDGERTRQASFQQTPTTRFVVREDVGTLCPDYACIMTYMYDGTCQQAGALSFAAALHRFGQPASTQKTGPGGRSGP